MNGRTTRFLGILVRREAWTVSAPAKLLLLSAAMVAALWLRWEAHPFLAVNGPVTTDTLIVEGWIPSHVLKEAAAEVMRGSYSRVIVVRAAYDMETPLGVPVAEEFVATRLQRYGVPRERVTSIFYMAAQRDRTYHSALAVKDWFVRNGGIPKSVNLATIGPHARRSWILFKDAFGDSSEVGIVALPDSTYDPKHWWRASEGVREVLGEAIAYVYARFFFGWTEQPSIAS
jgi:hypothetical protein